MLDPTVSRGAFERWYDQMNRIVFTNFEGSKSSIFTKRIYAVFWTNLETDDSG